MGAKRAPIFCFFLTFLRSLPRKVALLNTVLKQLCCTCHKKKRCCNLESVVLLELEMERMEDLERRECAPILT
jgi:hypothetical protein